jgi:hypothetical protein
MQLEGFLKWQFMVWVVGEVLFSFQKVAMGGAGGVLSLNWIKSVHS